MPRARREVLGQLVQVAAGSTASRNIFSSSSLYQRWFVMRDAREQGATWDQIAEALGLRDAEAARAYYLNAIEHQERYVGDLHEARRARAVL